jgi:hypothetical protein
MTNKTQGEWRTAGGFRNLGGDRKLRLAKDLAIFGLWICWLNTIGAPWFTSPLLVCASFAFATFGVLYTFGHR